MPHQNADDAIGIDPFDNELAPTDNPLLSRILVVGDGVMLTTLSLAKVVNNVRNYRELYDGFSVDLAHRQEVSSDAIQFQNFRFDQVDDDGRLIINRYDQIWCFGFNPGNDADEVDSVIDDAMYDPVSYDEAVELGNWMAAGGGLFATGDHLYLGASMCSHIIRVRHMRRWTIAQGVPPSGLTENNPAGRYDTNRPKPESPFAKIWDDFQGDEHPQEIIWKPYSRPAENSPIPANEVGPHPLLCHPTLGPIGGISQSCVLS